MPTFAYRAVDQTGRRSRGRIDAASTHLVTRELEQRGLVALDVTETAAAQAGSGLGFGRSRAVLEFTRAIAALLPAGMPLSKALRAAVATSPEAARPILDQVRARVERGDELASALAEHPRVFTPFYIGIVRAGEKSGELDGAFTRLVTHLERQEELNSKLISMSIYPVLLAIVGMAAISLLVMFVLPRFSELLLSSGATLPRMTAIMFALSTFSRAHWHQLLLIPIAVILFVTWLRTTDAGRIMGANLLVRLPLAGSWRKQALAAQFARMVGELLAGGAPLLAALGDTRDCMSDPVARAETERIRTRVREGVSLHAAIEQSALPEVLAQLVALGEEAGKLSDFLLKAADLLERRTEQSVERMVALAEPIMIVSFGGLVAMVALALLQAIYGVNAGSFK